MKISKLYSRNKQIIDQGAHFIVGALAVLAVTPMMGGLAAFIMMMVGAFVREVMQHKGFDLGYGSAVDLAFFAIGGLGGCIAVWLITR